MITFFICLILLVVGYFVYSRVSEKIFRINPKRLTPAIAAPDGVDRVPLPIWKATLIELLNIAGTGPIFGAISGALFGPIAFIWIVLGCILGGAVHDYMSGMISMRHNGESMVSLAKIYLGKGVMWIMRIFSLLVLLLVTACFIIAPSNLLENLTGGYVIAEIWLVIILAYYFISTIFPIDKVIGKIYPVFGVLLMLMAVSVIGSILYQTNAHGNDFTGMVMQMPELTLSNLRDLSASNGGVPWWPFMFTTISCGAISGFHATQTPMVAKCVKNETEGRKVFYGAMVLEGIIALIWCATAMTCFRVTSLDGWNTLKGYSDPGNVVYDVCSKQLGLFGIILAVTGVIICPITSGDTALRSTRLIISEWFHIDQKPIKNRIFVTLPLFGIVAGLSVFGLFNQDGFNILWQWFVWANQVFAAMSLWISTSFLIRYGRYRFGSLLTALPATFMTGVVVCFLFADKKMSLGKLYPNSSIAVGSIIAGVAMAAVLIIYLYKLFTAHPPIEQPKVNFNNFKPAVARRKHK